MTRPKLANIITTLSVIALALFVWAVAGCTQVIIEQKEDGTKRFKVNTFLMTSGLDSLYYDPNDGFFEVGKYSGVPADVEVEVNPLARTYILRTDAN